VPFGPWPGVRRGTGSAPLVDLALSFGHGNGGTDEQLPSETSWWFTPTGTADDAQADQVREWVTDTALGFLAIIVRIDAATINGETGALYVVTVDGAETAISVELPTGATTDTTLEMAAIFAVAAGSKVGVKFNGSAVADGSSLRTEVRLVGAETGTPSVPPALPADPIAVFESEDLADDGLTWIDSTGNLFDLAVPVAGGAGPPTVVPGAFNGHKGASFDGVQNILSTENAMFAGGAVPQPRTLMAVVRPTNATGGTVGCFKETADYFSCALWKTAGNQFAYENGDANNSLLSSVVDYGGEDLVLIFRTNGILIELFVNGVLRASTTNTVGPENGIADGFTMGNMLAHFGDRGWLGLIGAEWVWDYRFTNANVVSGTGYASVKYL
jgi:hypothetical protein